MSYKGILHGEAIGIGMVFASAISVEKSTLTINDFNLVEETIRNLKLEIDRVIEHKYKITVVNDNDNDNDNDNTEH